jgi:hypothetical protein
MTNEEEQVGFLRTSGDERTLIRDPTKNVLDLVAAAILRQDDLRNAESRHVREMANIRANYETKLREAETQRIDAIRAVDVGAVNRAAEVATTQASTLAAQVATSAETLRNQVAAAATAQTVALAAALEPVQKDIADLRRAQYEQQGVKTQIGESRAGTGATNAIVGTAVAFVVLLVLIFSAYLALRHTTAPVPAVTVTVPATTSSP